jgi:arylsulfatase A-like enzyme
MSSEATASSTGTTEADTAKPNIILITLDAFRYDLLMANLDTLPNLRALRSQSASFENAFSTGPLTFFSFPGIVASVYSYHLGVGLHEGVKGIDELLRDHGFNASTIIEKNGFLGPFFGYALNAQYHVCVLSPRQVTKVRQSESASLKRRGKAKARHDIWRHYPMAAVVQRLRPLWRGKKRTIAIGKYFLSAVQFSKLQLTRKTASVEEDHETHRRFRDTVLDFIDSRFESPQFLWIHTMVNHAPYLPPQCGSEFSQRKVNYLNSRAISGFLTRKVCGQLRRVYVESMKVTDSLVGDVLHALETNGLLETSIIILTADHGEEFMEDGYFLHDAESSSDRLLHVPLMFYCPSLIQPKTISASVSSIDIAPTVCDLLGIEIPDTYRGLSLKALLSGMHGNAVDADPLLDRAFFSEAWQTRNVGDRRPGYESHKRVFSVRRGAFKLIVMEEQIGEDTVSQMLQLVDWVHDRRLSLKGNRELVEDLKVLLSNHIRTEGLFATQIRRKAEAGRIRDALARARTIQPS